MRSTQHTREVAVGGVIHGLIGLGEEVTGEATHFGVRQRLTSKITAFNRPTHFRDSRVRGAFRRFDHDHRFQETSPGQTLMRDIFDYSIATWPLGRVADRLFLQHYMTALLKRRNTLIKEVAEQSNTVLTQP